ncbi:MAG: S41 family peptidase [Minisyncoccota bacterium]
MDLGKKHVATLAALVGVALLSFQLGFYKGANETKYEISTNGLINIESESDEKVDFGAFWKAWSIVKEDFVPTGTTTEEVTDQTMVWGAISGMVDALGDPYTVFFPPRESEEFAEGIKGSFGGVGMEVGLEDGMVTVIAPLKGSPAETAGMRTGDKILKINETDTRGLSVEEAVTFIRGEEGTSVTLTISRNGGTPFEVSIVRQVINIPSIETKKIGDDVFYIALYSFTENSPQNFRMALREFIESGTSKLVLDLRGNPGGYLEAAIDMASWFLPSGATVIREDRGDGEEEKIFRSKGYNIFTDNLKFAILVDGGSASASEILAGALSEHGVATLVGEQTFGKGSVQELVPVTSNTSLKVTIARWLTPNGTSISATGITPDIEVEFNEEEFLEGVDTQLNRAVEFLRTGN